MSSTIPKEKTTIWLWPSGLFPRRLVYYFRAKHITLSVLEAHGINLIPVALSTTPPVLESLPGYEGRPKDTSLPVLRIAHADGGETWIRESVSILEYLEELFPNPSLLGKNAAEKAQTRDILHLLSDAMHWSLIRLINSDPQTTSWSGLSKDEMSESAAAHAEGKTKFYLDRLESWVQSDGGAAMGTTTIAGIALLAQVEYHEMMYGDNWIAEHMVLGKWVDGMKEHEWYIESEVMKGVEQGKSWDTILLE